MSAYDPGSATACTTRCRQITPRRLSDTVWHRQERSLCHHRCPYVPETDNHLRERVRQHRRTIEGLSRIGPEGISPGESMQHVVAQVSRVTNVERIKIMRYRPERGDLFIEAGVGWSPGVVGTGGSCSPRVSLLDLH